MSTPTQLSIAAVAVGAPCLAWLHAIHMLAGHAWFANYGLLVAAVPAAVVAYAALARYGSRWVAIGGTTAMVLLFLVAEWLEGELAADHRLAWPTIADHGWPVLFTAGAFAGCALATESVRMVRLIRGLLDGR